MALVRVVNVDFYMSQPIANLDVTYSEFRGSSIHQVPIIRIFGPSNTGQKTCLHIHGVYPYIYVPFDASDKAETIMYQMAFNLDKAINICLGQAGSSVQHIYKIILVSGIPLYGYHAREHQFLKIHFYNPLILKKACMLLQNGSIMGKIYQPHEAHIPFILQFMIDYNLHGMSFISLSKVLYRRSADQSQNLTPDMLLPPTIPKISTCQIEIDGLADDIVNYLEVASGQLAANPGITALWNDEKQRRRNRQQSSQLTPCFTQNRKNIKPTESHMNQESALIKRLIATSRSDGIERSSVGNNLAYPAETPYHKHILNASVVLSHTPTSQSFPIDTVLQNSDLEREYSVSLNNSSDILFDIDAQNLFNLLKDLGMEEDQEKDSVLSQKVVENENEEEDIEEFDMNLPLDIFVNESNKILPIGIAKNHVENNLNTEYIPQLDGPSDNLKKEMHKIKTRKRQEGYTGFRKRKPLKKMKRRKSKTSEKTTMELKNLHTSQEEIIQQFLSSGSKSKNNKLIKRNTNISLNSCPYVKIQIKPKKRSETISRLNSMCRRYNLKKCKTNISTIKKLEYADAVMKISSSGKKADPEKSNNTTELLSKFERNRNVSSACTENNYTSLEIKLVGPLDKHIQLKSLIHILRKVQINYINMSSSSNNKNASCNCKECTTQKKSLGSPKKCFSKRKRNESKEQFINTIFRNVSWCRVWDGEYMNCDDFLTVHVNVLPEHGNKMILKIPILFNSSGKSVLLDMLDVNDFFEADMCGKRSSKRSYIQNLTNSQESHNLYNASSALQLFAVSEKPIQKYDSDYTEPIEGIDSSPKITTPNKIEIYSNQTLSETERFDLSIFTTKCKYVSAIKDKIFNSQFNNKHTDGDFGKDRNDLNLLETPPQCFKNMELDNYNFNSNETNLEVGDNNCFQNKNNQGSIDVDIAICDIKEDNSFRGLKTVQNLNATILKSYKIDSKGYNCLKSSNMSLCFNYVTKKIFSQNIDIYLHNAIKSNIHDVGKAIQIEKNQRNILNEIRNTTKSKGISNCHCDQNIFISLASNSLQNLYNNLKNNFPLSEGDTLEIKDNTLYFDCLQLIVSFSFQFFNYINDNGMLSENDNFGKGSKNSNYRKGNVLNSRKNKHSMKLLIPNYNYIISKIDIPSIQSFIGYMQYRIERHVYSHGILEMVSKRNKTERARHQKEAIPTKSKNKEFYHKQIKGSLKSDKENCQINSKKRKIKDLTFISLDGALDSSTDEETECLPSKKMQSQRRNSIISKYSPLKVTIKPPSEKSSSIAVFSLYHSASETKDSRSNIATYPSISFKEVQKEKEATSLKPVPANKEMKLEKTEDNSVLQEQTFFREYLGRHYSLRNCSEQKPNEGHRKAPLPIRKLPVNNKFMDTDNLNDEQIKRFDENKETENLGNCLKCFDMNFVPAIPTSQKIYLNKENKNVSPISIKLSENLHKISENVQKHITPSQLLNPESKWGPEHAITKQRCDESDPNSCLVSKNIFQVSLLLKDKSISLELNTKTAKDDLTKSEIYDIQANYVPKPGPSGLYAIAINNNFSCSSGESTKELTISTNYKNLELFCDQQSISFQKETFHVISVEENVPFTTKEFLSCSSENETVPSFPPSSSSSLLAPYKKNSDKIFFSNLTQQLSLCEFSSVDKQKFNLTKDGFTVIMPKYNPPSSQMIRVSMHEFNIPQIRYQEPHYSNLLDVTNSIEVGHNTLKIPSNKSIDLQNFIHESLDCGLSFYRNAIILDLFKHAKDKHNIKLSFCLYDCIVTPAKLPPSKMEIREWINEQNSKQKFATVKRERKKKMVLSSPNNGNDSCDESLTLTLCTPIESRINDFSNTPKLSEIKKNLNKSDNITPTNGTEIKLSPTFGKKKIKNKRKAVSRKRLCDTFSHDIHNVENSTLKQNEGNKINNTSESEIEEVKVTVLSQSTSDVSLRKTLLQTRFISSFQSCNNKSSDLRQITNVTVDNSYGFKMSSENLQKARAVTEHQFITLLLMELHTKTRGDYKPDPEYDPIQAVFYSVFNDVVDTNKQIQLGIIAVNINNNMRLIMQQTLDVMGLEVSLIYVDSEIELINKFIEFTRNTDPDILAGYEIEMQSWGYLIERGHKLNINLKLFLSRSSVELKYGDNTDSQPELKLTGRIILDVWRLLRHEITLQSYTFENVVYHILHKRVPQYSFKDLSFWWEHQSSLFWKRTADYYICRVQGVLNILKQLDIIERTSELARLFGIQFYEVLSRGSQFRVESMMLRLAKPLNYIAVSPSVQQRAKMNAPEYLPLILEPQSRFYADPVIVLDFQSLYPSMIIAYNYCFSTCLGKIERLGKDTFFEFGVTQLKVSRNRLKRLIKKKCLNISPCGAAFVKEEIREGILPRMLREILDARLMVKNSMKENPDDKILQRVLHNRQLGLKLIANVTYGYTAANFSGRMPSVEVSDSVVSKGRETLLRAIKLVENTSKWNAKVIYGDTDSIFILVAGRNREEAFKIGEEIAEAVTNDNPSPVKLKLEKVFQPCILQTKKRYVGYMYESPNQSEPEFCAKGIETVRRDGCPAASKMLEKSLRILFDTRDVSLVRQYVVRQFEKLLSGCISIQDVTFAKEYRGTVGYRPGACVPALELARKWKAMDRRSEPLCKDRVPYVIVNGPPGLPIIKLVRSPRELLCDSNLRINALYYITHVIIPPLNRCFTLIGVDINIWFREMPRKQVQNFANPIFNKNIKGTISQYFSTTTCATCSSQTQSGLCKQCLNQPQKTITLLQDKVKLWEKGYYETYQICQSCCRLSDDINCISLDCPILYRLNQTRKDLQQRLYAQQLMSRFNYLEF